MPDSTAEQQKKKAYYTKQRKDAEAGEKRGNVKSTLTARKIHEKGYGKTTNAERDYDKPGASEGEQMGNLALGLSGIGDVGGIVARGLSRVVEDVASHSALASRGAMRLPEGEAKSTLGPAMRRMKSANASERPALQSTARKALPKPKSAVRKSTAKPRAKKKVPVAA